MLSKSKQKENAEINQEVTEIEEEQLEEHFQQSVSSGI